jgi:F-type H+-transporting ATPase subunit gamma
MISTRDIKRKIKTIRNIQQMCRAMKTVSLVKLQKAEARLAAARPYAAGMGRCLGRLAGILGERLLPGGAAKETKAVAVVTSDKGLCGGYNALVIRRAQKEIGDSPVVAVGRKSERFFRRRGNPIIESLVPLGSETAFGQVTPLADRLAERLKAGEIGSLRAVYGHFLRGTRSEITAADIFPLEKIEEEIILEPAAPEMAKCLLGRYLRAALYAVVVESAASEHGARVAAMTAASDNADEMISELTMDYNKARQATITKELSEIVGSAEALR